MSSSLNKELLKKALEMNTLHQKGCFSTGQKATWCAFSISTPKHWQGGVAPAGAGTVAVSSSDGCRADGEGEGAGKLQAQMASTPNQHSLHLHQQRRTQQGTGASWSARAHTGSDLMSHDDGCRERGTCFWRQQWIT